VSWITAFAASTATIVSLSALGFNLLSVRTADFQRVLELHTELTTGPVAEARHIVGAALEGRTGPVEIDRPVMEALFTVLWCFERIDVARDTLLGQSRWAPQWISARKALDFSVERHVRMYLDYLGSVRYQGEAIRFGASDADAGIRRLALRLQAVALDSR
jgi:hypothetical protein